MWAIVRTMRMSGLSKYDSGNSGVPRVQRHEQTQSEGATDKGEHNQNSPKYTHGRNWQLFNSKQLLPPRGSFVLSSNMGTGKSTLVYWLASEMVRTTHCLPIVMTCEELERLAPKTYERHPPWLPRMAPRVAHR